MNATAGSHGSGVYSFVRNRQTLFHNGCTFYILLYLKQCIKLQFLIILSSPCIL